MHIDTQIVTAFFIGALFAAPAYLLVGLVAGAIFSGRIRRGKPIVSLPLALGGKTHAKPEKEPDKGKRLGYYDFGADAPRTPPEATPEQITEALRRSRAA